MKNKEWGLKMLSIVLEREARPSDIKNISTKELAEKIDDNFNSKLSKLIEDNMHIIDKPIKMNP